MSADKKQLASWKAMQDRLPVGSAVKWTTGTYHVDHANHEIATGVVVSHTERNGMTQVTAAAVFLGVSMGVGIVMLQLFRVLFNALGSDFFDKFPLFPFTIIGGVLVQLCAVRFRFEWAVNRRAVEGLGGLATDGIVICAIGTLSLGALGAQIGPLIILTVASVGWSVFLTMVMNHYLLLRIDNQVVLDASDRKILDELVSGVVTLA